MYKVAIKLPKPSLNAHYNLGVCLEKMKQNKEAITQFK